MRNTITPEEFEAEMRNFVPVLDQGRRIGLQKAERLHLLRGIANTRELARMKARDKSEVDSTLEQAEVTVSSVAAFTQLQSDLRAADFLAKLKPEQISALGRIVTENALPAAGFQLRVLADSGALIAEASVDKSGIFAIKMTRVEFDKRADKTTKLTITIFNPAGALEHRAQFPHQPGPAVMLWNFDLSVRNRPQPPRTVTVTVADVKGVGQSRVSKLAEAGITEVAHLARQPPEKLAKLLKISADQAEEIIRNAKELLRE
jgi:hypothetical protein